MNERPPIDLRSLADVDSPEVVHEALRTFRRRTLVRFVWLVMAAGIGAIAVWWGNTPTTLAERVDSASTAIEAHPSWHVPGGAIGLDRVALLDDGRLGFHLVVIRTGRYAVELRISGQVASEEVGWLDRYVEIERPTTGYPTLTITVRGRRWPISLGPGSGVTEEVWSMQGG